jgi:NAD(P)-dependent dehydrogenase (short-subunit alcohol dehydrogenase family)
LQLLGKTALVTGASRGIGRAIAVALAKDGADVAVNYVRDAGGAEETAAAVEAAGRRSLLVQADVTRRQQVEAMVARVLQHFGRIDILVCNAGVLTRTPFLELTDEQWEKVVSTNLTGPFLVGQAAARQMVKQGGGKIINVTSEVAERALPNLSHYCASKGGLRQLTKAMAIELAPYGISVNAVAPGTTETDINRDRLALPEERKLRLTRVPIGRFNQPENVAAAVVFLASSGSDTMVGATVAVDGGSTVT